MVDAAGSALADSWQILLFLVLITAVSDLCDDAGCFRIAARVFARLARGHTAVLLGLYVVLATATTVLLGLDTTAVMLTPVALELAHQHGLNPLPFAFATVWLANAASLLLPISNLTNLLAVAQRDQSAADFIGEMWLPQVAVLLVVVVVLGLRYRRVLGGRFDIASDQPRREDRPLAVIAGVVALAIAIATVVGVTPWVAALAGLVALLAITSARQASGASAAGLLRRVPVAIVAGVFAMFVVVELVLQAVGTDHVDWHGPVALALTGAAGSNVVNNLPAWLALSAVTDSNQFPALLVGVNVGGVVAMWGSLANLLWWRRCREAGLEISWWTFTREGLILAPLAVVIGALAVAMTSG